MGRATSTVSPGDTKSLAMKSSACCAPLVMTTWSASQAMPSPAM
ncbi:MAG TPA: hypothetical protein VF930_07875 [Stellaceae bacterium]